MNIGLYFGSFNPIHIGHLIIANHILNTGLIDKLWFVISPQNPFKINHSLLNEYDRMHLVTKSTEEDPRIKVSDVEFHLSKPSFTVNTLNHLKEKHPDYTFFIIMGSDSFQNLPQWHNAQAIMNHYEIIVYPRPGFEVVKLKNVAVHITDAPLLEISSTLIRKLVKEGKSIRYLVPELVREEIEANRYYKK